MSEYRDRIIELEGLLHKARVALELAEISLWSASRNLRDMPPDHSGETMVSVRASIQASIQTARLVAELIKTNVVPR